MSKPLTIQYTGKYANHLLREKEKEIERLGNELQVQIEDNIRLNEYIEAQDNKLQQKENIIKEAREKLINSKEYKMAKEMNLTSKMSVLIEIKDLLDKESSNGSN